MLRISLRAAFQAFCTIQESDRSWRVASAPISFSISSGKYRLCLRLSLVLISYILRPSGPSEVIRSQEASSMVPAPAGEMAKAAGAAGTLQAHNEAVSGAIQ